METYPEEIPDRVRSGLEVLRQFYASAGRRHEAVLTDISHGKLEW